ncbi:MAG: KpsF/GutQ family sugar-phosphate isomerase [Desulfovibrionaceae bacterium]|nr:KpsF/GutQ family sugar-phosphate isomerase [Desulfovibrionaceae bacterium]
MTVLEEARQVLRDEAAALERTAASLDDHFAQIIDCLIHIRGRIAVTGMGKSGHVARKIAATLASTGSPAYFIHPAEASHGDLGMMTTQDAVIAISNSGDTAELRDIILYASLHNMPIIAITRHADSFLGRHCSYLLLQPDLREACPLDCAPTTSTTVQLALGDAIALCLLSARGFSQEDFHRYHPGGALGLRLLHVREIMLTGDAMPLVSSGTSLLDALLVMTNKGLGCLGITDVSGRLIGIITDGDIRRHCIKGMLSVSVDSVMTRNPICIHPDALKEEVIALFKAKKISMIFAVEHDMPVGIVTVHTLSQQNAF